MPEEQHPTTSNLEDGKYSTPATKNEQFDRALLEFWSTCPPEDLARIWDGLTKGFQAELSTARGKSPGWKPGRPGDSKPTISESLDVLIGTMEDVGVVVPEVLQLLFADCDPGQLRDILYAYLDEPRKESAAERGDRMAQAAADWAPTALAKLTEESGGRFFEPHRVGEVAAGMASGARGYFGDDS